MFDKLGMYAVIGLIIVAAFGGLYTKYKVTENNLLKMTIERDNYQAAFKVKKLEVDNAHEAQKTLESLLTQEKEASLQLEKDLEDLKNEPESADGSVSDLLKRQLGKLHDDN